MSFSFIYGLSLVVVLSKDCLLMPGVGALLCALKVNK